MHSLCSCNNILYSSFSLCTAWSIHAWYDLPHEHTNVFHSFSVHITIYTPIPVSYGGSWYPISSYQIRFDYSISCCGNATAKRMSLQDFCPYKTAVVKTIMHRCICNRQTISKVNKVYLPLLVTEIQSFKAWPAQLAASLIKLHRVQKTPSKSLLFALCFQCGFQLQTVQIHHCRMEWGIINR